MVKKEFVIANIGESLLTISRAYTTCGCTTANFSATVIPPGKVSFMTLTYDAGFHDAQGQIVRGGKLFMHMQVIEAPDMRYEALRGEAKEHSDGGHGEDEHDQEHRDYDLSDLQWTVFTRFYCIFSYI